MSKTHSIILQGIQRKQLPTLGFAYDTFGEKAVANDRVTSIGGRKRAVRQRTNVTLSAYSLLEKYSVNGEGQSYFTVPVAQLVERKKKALLAYSLTD